MSKSTSEMNHVEILLLAGQKETLAFDLLETFRIAIGRHHSNEIVLKTRKVSNYHAEILIEVDGLLLRDLGSTNGTYVNDEKVRERRLKHGDQIRFGGHQFTVCMKTRRGVDATMETGPFPVGARGELASLRAEPRLAGAPSPEPENSTLPDLLKYLCRSNRTVALVVKKRADEGRIFFDKGQLIHAELGKVRGDKALYRILGWPGVTFEVQEFQSESVSRSIEVPFDTLVAEGLQQADELEKLTVLLPPPVVPIRLDENCPLPLCELSPAEIEILQELIRHQTIARILEASPMTDFRILSIIWGLLKKKVFAFAQSSSNLLEETFIQPM